jgi:hypothetical protein
MKNLLVVMGSALALVACGGNDGVNIGSDGGGDGAIVGEGGTLPLDSGSAEAAPVESGPDGAPSSTYPAFTPWMAQLSNNGDAVLSAPTVVTITWDVDTSRALFEGFGDGIGASSYWSAAVGEYGVGPVTSGAANHAHVSTAPPSQMSDADIQTFITSNLGTLLPQPTSQTLYVVYLAKTTTLIFQGNSACQSGIGGYHDSFQAGQNKIAYAVLPRCGSDNGVTRAASHEIGEAATDPHPNSGYSGFDDPFLAFELWQRNNDENGDACEFFADSTDTEPSPFNYVVQRLWSNKMGPLGHSPCQPFTATYFNMVPLDLQDITVDLSQSGGPANFKTKGYTAAVGATIQIPIGFYSDAATGPWTVSAAESNPLVNPVTGRLAVSIDTTKTTGVNGEKTFLNVTVNQAGPLKAELLTLISTLGQTKHYLPLLISNP